MRNIGSGNNGEWTFLDIITLISFCIGLQNLDLNVTQDDAQALQQRTDANAKLILEEIHKHLEEQDKKIDYIIERLNNDSR